jgi:hypothetical protein
MKIEKVRKKNEELEYYIFLAEISPAGKEQLQGRRQ